ncbi:MAG TPA: hypothetical protein VD905_00405 [Flavobacteriales bacterium]|nr:hypothetical protein [Flavobacteriales bacterium]
MNAQKRSVFVNALTEIREPVEDYHVQITNLNGDSLACYHPLTHFPYEIELPDTSAYIVQVWKKGFVRYSEPIVMPETEKLLERESVTAILVPIGEIEIIPVEFKAGALELTGKQLATLTAIGQTFSDVQHQCRLEITLLDSPDEKMQTAGFRRIKITEILKNQGCDVNKITFFKESIPGPFVPTKKQNSMAMFKVITQ